MISIIQETFDSSIANHIIRFLEHPTAPLIRRFKEYTDLLSFDTVNDWHKWQSLYGFQTITGSRRAYVTYGGGPEGGVVRLFNTMTGKAWYVWHRDWGRTSTFVRIPEELALVTRYDDGYEAIKLVMDDYELRENENYLDDVEDANDENYPDEIENPADEGGDSDAETEYADESLVYAQFLNNEAREEIASLVEQIRAYNDQMSPESSVSETMTLNMLINQAYERCRELGREIENRRDLTS